MKSVQFLYESAFFQSFEIFSAYVPKDSSDKALKGFATCLCKCLYTPMWDRNGGMNMAKTTWKVISYYEGTQTVQEILVDLIAEKIRREKSNKGVENNEERDYNLGMSYEDDLPGLAG